MTAKANGADPMMSPEEARERAMRRYARTHRNEAVRMLLASADPGIANATPDANRESNSLSLSLRPPTEAQALQDLAAARMWVDAWRESPLAPYATWERRKWPSVGTQDIPVRLIACGIEEVSKCAGVLEEWQTTVRRVRELAECFERAQASAHPRPHLNNLAEATRKIAGSLASLDESSWQTALSVIGWLARNDAGSTYIRQLPIHGIDTKWMESHKKLMKPLVRAFCGNERQFAQPGKLIQMHALDRRLALDGIERFALPVDCWERYPHRPDSLLVCENLVNTLALPPLEGVLAIHGGGYAVADIAQASWVADIPIAYWGDLDSNGFAILNRLRSHLPHAMSVMMDIETIERHIDLCVEEPSPFTGSLSLLNAEEQVALDRLLAGDGQRGISALRLEQERIEWEWACGRITKAIGGSAHRE